jgi:predicted DCC family thiol-disulfide oxidoreductase YuxK
MERDMRSLYVLYDSDCGLCRQLARWLALEPAWIPLYPVPAQSAWVASHFPSLASAAATELTVVSDDGAVWRGDRAWIMCLYALRQYRAWAAKLAHPILLPLARQAFAALSRNRAAISRFTADHELADRLSQTSAPSCAQSR